MGERLGQGRVSGEGNNPDSRNKTSPPRERGYGRKKAKHEDLREKDKHGEGGGRAIRHGG